ncbi:MAG: Wzz/FepE/Etk N-terminal domain-containing protein, partial [Deltaproteobacteria bacterium]|nr:Wzz/FepE/Etk N-terminal domain-containing protein [Deltaproteobacteria bacterium]
MQQAPESEINPLEYFQVLNRGKRLIATVVVTACFVAVVISFILPKTYRARAVVMPVSRGGAVAGGPASVLSTNALASGLGAELLGVGGGGGNPQLMVLLRSRTLAEMVVEKLDLMPLFFESQWDRETKQWKSKPPRIDAAANRLLGLITLNDDKKLYIINISADWTDPQMAATLANTYVEQLQRFINENQLTVAKKN